jgi:hypothetical protein
VSAENEKCQIILVISHNAERLFRVKESLKASGLSGEAKRTGPLRPLKRAFVMRRPVRTWVSGRWGATANRRPCGDRVDAVVDQVFAGDGPAYVAAFVIAAVWFALAAWLVSRVKLAHDRYSPDSSGEHATEPTSPCCGGRQLKEKHTRIRQKSAQEASFAVIWRTSADDRGAAFW